MNKCTFSIEDKGHEDAHGFGNRDYDRDEQQNLEPAIKRHQNFSGRNSA
jgi:hypothetical protein